MTELFLVIMLGAFVIAAYCAIGECIDRYFYSDNYPEDKF